jgi:hypothetical protein
MASMSFATSGASRSLAPEVPQFEYPGGANIQAEGCLPSALESRKANSTDLCIGGGNLREVTTLPTGLSAFRPHPAVNHPGGGRRMGK